VRASTDRGGDGGFAELVPLLMLTLVVGLALILHSVSVIHARWALSGASRDATRAYVESETAAAADRRAARAASDAYGEFESVAPLRLERIAGGYRRCQPVTFEAATRLPAFLLFGRAQAETRVRVRHTEIVDPYRSGPAGVAQCE
jgi:hypothetical protein